MANEVVKMYRNTGTDETPVWVRWYGEIIAEAVKIAGENGEPTAQNIKQYVDAKIAALIGSSTPETLDTLEEIATWITNHAEVAEALNQAITNKADKNHTHADATTSASGFMSAADKAKLDGMEAGAQVNVIEEIKLNGTKVEPTEKSVNLQVLVAQDLANYYNKTEVDQKVSAIPKFAIAVVEELPSSDISTTTVYLVSSGDDDQNLYTEYIYVNSKWEKLGTQTVDLKNYVTKDNAISGAEAENATTIKFTRADGSTFNVTITGTVYTHPDSHPASMITEDTTHRFVSDTEKTAWNNKADIIFASDLPGTAPEAAICFLIEDNEE